MTVSLTYGRMPRWNPNGDKILFGDDTPGRAGLWIWDLQGDPVHPTDSLPPHNWDYRWSPDGAKIAFTAPGAPEDSVGGVWVVDLSSRVASRIFDRGRDVTWADSNRNLIFRVDDYPGGVAGIYEKGVGDVAPPRLVVEEGMLPAAAHQGNLLAFTDGATDAQLYIADIAATPLSVQTVSDPGASQWAWSGDGSVLYCVVNNYTAGVIKGILYKIAGHTPFNSDSLGSFIADPAPNRDGSQVAYLRSSGGRWSGVWVRHPTGEEVVISPYGLNPDMHPTLNRVAVNVTGGGIRVFEQSK
jgi:Tol biopolymer transport system component